MCPFCRHADAHPSSARAAPHNAKGSVWLLFPTYKQPETFFCVRFADTLMRIQALLEQPPTAQGEIRGTRAGAERREGGTAGGAPLTFSSSSAASGSASGYANDDEDTVESLQAALNRCVVALWWQGTSL